MESEDAARPRCGIARVAEVGFHAGGFVKKRKRAGESGGQKVRQAGGVTSGLVRDSGECRAFLLGFNHAQRLAVHKQQIVTRAGLERRFAQRNAASGGGVKLLVILYDPAARNQLRVDLPAGALLWGFRHGPCEAS
jgi:hypothetical protein